MHVDLWSPGAIEDDTGNKGYLLNYKDDISQFIISSPTTDITAVHLGKLFMAEVIFAYGMCSVVVIDDGSSFKGVFILMCTKLGITYWCLSRGNHRVNSPQGQVVLNTSYIDVNISAGDISKILKEANEHNDVACI